MSDKKKTKSDHVSKPASGAEKVTSSATGSQSSSNGLFILGIIVVAIIAVAGIFLFSNKKSDTEQEQQQQTVSEQPKESSTPQVPVASLTAEKPKKQTTTQVKQPEMKTAEKKESTEETDKPDDGSAPSQTVAPSLTATPSAGTAPAIPEIKPVPRQVPVTQRATAVPTRTVAQQYKHISAQDLTGGVRKPSVPRQLAQATPRELTNMAHQQRIAEVPDELGIDPDTPLGYVALPDGGQQFIIYGDNKTVSKIITLNKDGSKNIREMGDDGLVVSETTDDKALTYQYDKLDDGSTEVTVTDDNGQVTYRRTYNETGILVKENDVAEDDTFTYSYKFEGGQPVSFVKMDTNGAEVLSGAVSNSDKLSMQSLTFNATGATKSYTYIRGDAGTINMIVENKGTPDEVIRRFDQDGKLVSLEKKKTGSTYIYRYDDSGTVVKITVTDSEGNTKDVDPNDPEFAFLENETQQFDPIEFSKGILEHKNIMQYYNQNMLNKRVQQVTQPQQLPTANSLTTVPGVPAKMPSANLPKAAPASAPKAPARAPGVPSIPRR